MTFLTNTYSGQNTVVDLINHLLAKDDLARKRDESSLSFGVDGATTNFPAVDIAESDNNYLFRAELPGFKSEDLDVRLEKGNLVLRGKKVEKPENAKYLYRERFSGEFVRQFLLPDDVLSRDLKAELKNGVLTIILPKKEKVKMREIKIQ